MESRSPGIADRHARESGRRAAEGRVLRTPDTCWRIARAERLAVIVDAAAYFAAAKAAILQARHSVFLIGWDFDLRIRLERQEADPEAPDELGAFLSHIVETRPDVRLYVLRWDLSFLQFPFRATLPLKVLDWLSGSRLTLHADRTHPLGACHHQKIVVIDDCLAFCGGIDMTAHRWDRPSHLDVDPLRIDPGGALHPPWHDATTCLDGDAARALSELARERWRRATGKTVPPAPPCAPIWPPRVRPDFLAVDVGICRTEPEHGTTEEPVREIEALYLAAIAAARRGVYIETQYFASHRIAEAIIARLQEEDGPEFVVVNPREASGWLEEAVMGAARALLLRRIEAADRHGRFRLYTPVTESGEDIYVHAKVMVVDDRILRVGSSNLNNRSMGLDTECDLVIEAGEDERPDSPVRARIAEIRSRLMEEHLGVTPDQLTATLAEANGSLIGAIEGLRRPQGRSLRPFEPPAVAATAHAMAGTGLLDPDRPESLAVAFRRARAIPAARRAMRLTLLGAAALAALRLMTARRLRRGR